jgi:hypothetical protein
LTARPIEQIEILLDRHRHETPITAPRGALTWLRSQQRLAFIARQSCQERVRC